MLAASIRVFFSRTNSVASSICSSRHCSKQILAKPTNTIFLSSSPQISSVKSRFSSPLSLAFRTDRTMASLSTTASVHDFTVKDSKGNDVNLGDYKGKVLLIVNVASQCGLTTSNYTELNQLYEKYKGTGFEILAFPCNQFGGQEPGSIEQIVEFACTRFKAEFPIFDKVDVNGDSAAPLYKYLKSDKGPFIGIEWNCPDGIEWNFSKFLVGKDGHVVGRYASTTSPLSIEKDIQKLLSA